MIEIQHIKDGIGETPNLYDEVYFFFICHNHLGDLICGSQYTATKAVIGRGWLIPPLEEALKQMKQGQRSTVKVFHSPATREYFDLYEIEIIRIGKRLVQPWHLEGEEIYQSAIQLKQYGNDDIKQQKYQEAQLKYTEALNLVKEEYCDREKELQQQLRSNLTLTHLKQKQYEKCIQQANLLLQENPNNVKLLHRRAVASIQIEDFENAKIDLKKAHELDSNNQEVIQELQSISEKEKIIKKKQQERAKKMLFGE